jgi:2-polyprenyl-3-methyl-5-hydroxy-6-metoxy-1,4-benzoquinol methylase
MVSSAGSTGCRGFMSNKDKNASLTERGYWDRTWESVQLPKLVDLSDRSVRNHATLAFHEFFADILGGAFLNCRTLVEIGCAQSKWLPYFAQVHGLNVAGVDYSELGCIRARELLKMANCEGEIVQADMFSPPERLKAHFDIVVSMGLVEHFPDTAAAIAACAAFAKYGGLIVTLVPNLAGAIGLAQRWLDRAIYDYHVPLSETALRIAHERNGLSILRSGYLMSANFAVINHPNIKSPIINKLVRAFLVGATGAIWTVERLSLGLPPTRLFSPYVVCVARKAATSQAS